jgi:transcriptional regulator with XRE-family HTH domain
MQKVRDYIKQRLNSGESQSAIARKIGISQPTVAKIASGDVKASDGTAMKIARAYGLPLSYFLEDADNLPPAARTIDRSMAPYEPLTSDELAILEMLKGDPALARQVRRFTQFEKSACLEDLENDTTKAA